MVRGYVPLLAIVAGIWGASYLFIKVAVEEIEPTAMMELRLLLAALVLVPFVLLRRGAASAVAELRATGGGAFVLGISNMAVSFTPLPPGGKNIHSGVPPVAQTPP